MDTRTTRRGLMAVVMGLAVGISGFAQGPDQMPKPDGEPQDATLFAPESKAEEYTINGPDGRPRTLKRMRIVAPSGYRSHTLRGTFKMQWMYIVQRGRMVTFWGARILSLEPDSPVWQLGVRPGDVLTRLDGIPLWRGMRRGRDGEWDIPEMERHYGATEVRYIRQGQHIVRVGQMILDGGYWDDGSGLEPLAP